jgi:methyl-accepting chemotaxis protein
LVFESGQTLSEILASVSEVSEIVAEITVASQEQRIGIEQVNSSVIYIDEMTKKNSTMVGNATISSENMASQAQNLSRLMSYFSTGDEKDSRTAEAVYGDYKHSQLSLMNHTLR